MKLLASLLLIGATSAPVLAGPATGYKSSGGFAREEKCFKTEYREEYVPGTAKNPGYVKSFKKKVRVMLEDVNLRSNIFLLQNQISIAIHIPM